MTVSTKRVISILFIFLILLYSSVFVIASDADICKSEQPALRYSAIIETKCAITISGTTAKVSASMLSNQATTLSISLELQKLSSGNYNTIATWSSSTSGIYLSLDKTRLINILCTYRLKVTFTAGNETVVSYAYP